MNLILNGESRSFSAATLSALVEQLGMKADRVAIELNREIVPREQWPQTPLRDGDQLEIVQFVGGGSSGAFSQQAAKRVESVTSAAKAAEENKAVIAALKRCATQRLQRCATQKLQRCATQKLKRCATQKLQRCATQKLEFSAAFQGPI